MRILVLIEVFKVP